MRGVGRPLSSSLLRAGASCLLVVTGPLACEETTPTPPAFDVVDAEPRVAARLTLLADAVRAWPDSAQAWGRLALSLQAHGYPEASLAAYETARELRPGTFPYLYLPAVLLADRGEPDAGRLFEEARGLRPDYVPLLLREAEWLLDRGRADEARELIAGSRAEREAPARSALLLGRAALALDEPAVARSHLEAAVRAAPRYGEAHAQLAEVYRRTGDEPRAALARERARLYSHVPAIDDPVFALVALEGVSSRWHIVRGQSLLSSGDPERAVEELRTATEILPEDAHAANQLGRALEAAGQLEEAAEAYRRAIDLRPAFGEAESNLARVLLRLDRDDEALGSLERLLASDSSASDAWLMLGLLEQERGRSSAAASAYEEGLHRTDFDPRLAIRLAWILASSDDPALRDPERAVALAERANLVGSHADPVDLGILSAAYAAAGDFERAARTARQAADLARRAGNPELAAVIEHRIASFESGRPYRE